MKTQFLLFNFVAGGLISHSAASSILDGALLRRETDNTTLTVQTSSGPVEGHEAPNAAGVSEYLGIPYAEPPVGDLRWKEPVKYGSNLTINGASFGFSCPQTSATSEPAPDSGTSSALQNLTAAGLNIIGTFFASSSNTSEDCLTLNVWTTSQSGDAPKPVIVWIHGGSFTSGGSSIPFYNGEYLASEQDIVVVSINYRLNIFGFPGYPNATYNLGIMDQRLALEWVRDNIAGFGGDPDRIVVAGQSAGAASVDIISYAYADDPIVAGLIAESGTAFGFGLQNQSVAAGLWFIVSEQLGCGGADSNQDDVLQCMMGKNASDITAAVPQSGISDTGLPFGPVVDEKIIFSDYFSRKPAPKPLLIGNTNDETSLYKLILPNATQVPDAANQAINNQTFNCPAATRAALSVVDGVPTWRYRWFGEFSNLALSWEPPILSWHGSEILILFNTTPQAVVPDSPEEVAVGKYLRGAWAAFASNPTTGLSDYGWPGYTESNSTLARLGFNNATGPNLALASFITDFDVNQ
ncbi:carboxylesterase [Xylariales sp. PMI_506]|nr:carboxylesterase [Xylariales sp. PMI_506]